MEELNIKYYIKDKFNVECFKNNELFAIAELPFHPYIFIDEISTEWWEDINREWLEMVGNKIKHVQYRLKYLVAHGYVKDSTDIISDKVLELEKNDTSMSVVYLSSPVYEVETEKEVGMLRVKIPETTIKGDELVSC